MVSLDSVKGPGPAQLAGPGAAARQGPRVPTDRAVQSEHVSKLGARLKRVREASGLSLREVARQLGVSPSFVSQLENGKSQPSVATLYSIAQLLEVSIDELFSSEGVSSPGTAPNGSSPSRADALDEQVSRSDLGSPADAWPGEDRVSRLSVTRPGERLRLEMDSGVVWERLASNTGAAMDFMEIIYPPHSTSTNDGRMLQHAGSEFGYVLEGELEITIGFDVFVLRAGEAVGFDSAMPHLLANKTDRPARGIWLVRHAHT